MDYEFRQPPAVPLVPTASARGVRLARMLGTVVSLSTVAGLILADVPLLLGFLIWAVVVVTMTRTIAYFERKRALPGVLLASLHPATASSICPRCERAERDVSGWCTPCFGALTPSSSARAVLDAMAAGLNARDDRVGERVTKFPFVSHVEGVGTGRVSRSGDRFLTRALFTAVPDLQISPVAAFEEKSDSGTVWLRYLMTGHARTGQKVRADRILRASLASGKLTELWEYPPVRVPSSLLNRTT